MNLEQLTSLRPDTPQWVDLRGFLLAGRCDVFANPDPETGFIVRPLDFPVAVAAGEPTDSVIRSATRGADATGTAWAGEGSEEQWHFLAPPESLPTVAAALPSWKTRGVTLHSLGPGGIVDAGDVDVRVGLTGWESAGWTLDHLPAITRHEYELDFVRGRPVAAVFVDERPVAFCYAAVQTETLWDVAVDTLPDHRRRGYAAACFVTLARHLAGKGLDPVWGSLDTNEASMKLAARLGFTHSARLTSFVRA
jgi:GNAT superfamily N-acetyltransferase